MNIGIYSHCIYSELAFKKQVKHNYFESTGKHSMVGCLDKRELIHILIGCFWSGKYSMRHNSILKVDYFVQFNHESIDGYGGCLLFGIVEL